MKQRPLKPEFWTDELVASQVPGVRLLYACCFNLADDNGNLPGTPRFLWHQAYGYDDSTSLADVTKWRNRLIKIKRLIEYTVNGQVYLHGPTFVSHFGTPKGRFFARYPEIKNGKKTTTYDDDVVREHDTSSVQTVFKQCGSGSGSGLGVGSGSSPNGDSPEPCRASRPRPTKVTYARAMREAEWGAQEVADLNLAAATSLDFILGHPWFSRMPEPEGWVAMQEQDRPGINVRQQLFKAAKWLVDTPAKSGNKTDIKRFLAGWLNRSRPDERMIRDDPMRGIKDITNYRNTDGQ